LAEEKKLTVSYPIWATVQAVFIVLKCTNLTAIGAWPWWKVMLPSIISVGAAMLVLTAGVGLLLVAALIDRSQKKKLERQRAEARKVASFSRVRES
jgi:hypothetical protein